ncbi:MAG: hypothetical protein ACOYO1_02905 [Bacteroidales bacterium]
MRLIYILLITNLFIHSFGQDTTKKIVLKPISRMPFERILTQEQSEKIKRNKVDSINNTYYCIKKRQEYKDSCFREYSKELKEKEQIVKELNSKNTGYYYYIYNSCDLLNYYECEGCIGPQKYAFYWNFKIMKKEKSRIILDGPTGEVYYYEDDIWRMPK